MAQVLFCSAFASLLSCQICWAGEGFLPRDDATIFIATGSFGGGGSLVSMQRQAPWDTVTVAVLDSDNPVVQSFSGEIYVVEPDTDRVRVFDGAGVERRSFDVGPGTSPRDILGVARNRAYVTRAGSTQLYRVDPQTGAGMDVLDLGLFADADGLPDMERMATDGSRLFVQLRRLDGHTPAGNGAIAVVDLATETLIDVLPGTPEIDAIELVGPAPRLRMHVDAAAGYLLVSATDGNHLSLGGGIEYVDLPALATQGLILAEIELAALGGFAITDPDGGYFLFHTDIIPSNHLTTFTIAGGPDGGTKVVFDGGVYLDALLFDAESSLLYMPASEGGLYVVDTVTNTPVVLDPLPLPGFPVDQVIGPIGNPYDLTGDGVVDTVDLLALLAAWGPCAGCVADLNADGAVDTADFLLLLANWTF